MAQSVKILNERLLSQKRFRLTTTTAEIVEADGSRRIVDHEIYHYGQAAAVLLYDPVRRLVRLVKQFRLAAYFADGALETIEVCAGMLDGDQAEACVIREAFEETGVRVAEAKHAFNAYMSPGGVTEIIGCFVAPYGAADCIGAGGGVDADEHIEILEVSIESALAMIDSGAIRDAKTIALLYYAKARGCFDAPC
ncbi:MAG: NUDIX domain-containing protein [Hyphomicrobiales bacterium]|nr:NUDIX domain-containing protein [Hyphomicrobiales bacterium]